MSKKQTENNMLPVDFLGDVCAAQTKATVKYEYKYGSNAVEIECRPSLSYAEHELFIETIWDFFYSDDGHGNVDYRPYLLEILIRLLTVKYYCVNVPIDLSKDVRIYENFLMNTTFYDELCKHITDHELLIKSLMSYIDLHVEANIAAMKSTTEVLFNNLLIKLTNVVDKLDGIPKDELQALINTITNRTEKSGDSDA